MIPKTPPFAKWSEFGRYAQGKRSRDEEDYLCQDCDVVLTVEPCIMCAMALVHSRSASCGFLGLRP